MSEVILSFSKEQIHDKPKVYTFGFNQKTTESLEQLAETANRYAISGPSYQDGHRSNGNIINGSNLILIDCDEPGQAEAVTRAKDELTISSPKYIYRFGSVSERERTMFLDGLEDLYKEKQVFPYIE